MSYLLSLPMELRLGLLFVLGAVVGGQVNRGVYRLAWDKREIGPWSVPPPGAPPRRWFDRIPILGWWGLAREASLHGTGYWLRPLLIEFFMGLGFASLYWWEVGGHHLPWPNGPIPPVGGTVQAALHAGFIAHLVLISLMMVATFIDFDEKTIPDEITVPGALAGLLFAAVLPVSLLPVGVPAGDPVAIGLLKITSPQMQAASNWPDWLNGPHGLTIAWLCLAAWCFAILPRTWWTRSGPRKTLQYLVASICRQRLSLFILALFLAGGLGISGVWGVTTRGSWHWQALLSALVGMVFGGGLIWMVRAIGSRAMAKEAMGFGDVTLMAMIGAFVGWQPSLIIFFLAPMAGLLIALTQWAATGRKDIAYGPFLCMGTLVLLICWGPIWNGWGWPAFRMGWLVVAMLAVCLVLMGAMLTMWRAVTR